MHYYIQCTYYFTILSPTTAHIRVILNNSPDQYYLPFPFETGIVVAQERGLGSVYNEK